MFDLAETPCDLHKPDSRNLKRDRVSTNTIDQSFRNSRPVGRIGQQGLVYHHVEIGSQQRQDVAVLVEQPGITTAPDKLLNAALRPKITSVRRPTITRKSLYRITKVRHPAWAAFGPVNKPGRPIDELEINLLHKLRFGRPLHCYANDHHDRGNNDGDHRRDTNPQR